MNRNITLETALILNKYTDINLIAGSVVGITAASDDINKRVNLTISNTSGVAFITSVTDTASVDLSVAAQALTATVLPAGVNHNALANLTVGDPHTQYGLEANPLSQFASTTSAQLAGVISDETGSGSLVFANTPTLVTPVLGAATATSLDINGTTTTNSLIVDGVTLNTVIVDTTTLIVDAMSHNVGIGTATPAYKLTVQGGAVDFFGGYFHCDGTTGMTTLSELTVNNNAGISTANITTGNITTINATTGNIVTISATTVGTNTVNADEMFVSKNQNAATQLHVNNTTAGTDAVVGVIMGTDDTAELNLVVTSSLFTGFPNAAALTVNAEGGLYIENTLGDIIIEPLQEADGNGFNVNITASDGFDSGVTARNGGNLVLTAGLGVNGGTNGGIKIPVIKSGATQAAAGAAANEIWKTSGHSSLPDNVLMIGV